MPLYIIAIAWTYIAVLMAATEPNLVAGAMTFIFYGLAPLALLLWLLGAPERGRRRRRQEAAETASGADEDGSQTPPAPR